MTQQLASLPVYKMNPLAGRANDDPCRWSGDGSLREEPHFRFWVESRCGAVALGRTYLLPPLSSGGALLVQPWLRFHIPLIEPDRQISRIRLSDKTSRFRVQRP